MMRPRPVRRFPAWLSLATLHRANQCNGKCVCLLALKRGGCATFSLYKMQRVLLGEVKIPFPAVHFAIQITMSFASELNFLENLKPTVDSDTWMINQIADFYPYNASNFQLTASSSQCELFPNSSDPVHPAPTFPSYLATELQNSALPYKIEATDPLSTAADSAFLPTRSSNQARYHPYNCITPEAARLANTPAPLMRGIHSTLNVKSGFHVNMKTPYQHPQWASSLETNSSVPTLPANPMSALQPAVQNGRSGAESSRSMIKQEVVDLQISTQIRPNVALNDVQGRASQNVKQVPAPDTQQHVQQLPPQALMESLPQYLYRFTDMPETPTPNLLSLSDHDGERTEHAAEQTGANFQEDEVEVFQLRWMPGYDINFYSSDSMESKPKGKRATSKKTDPGVPIVCRLPKASEGAVAGEICNASCDNATALMRHFSDSNQHNLPNNKNDKVSRVCGWFSPDGKTQCEEVLSNSGGVCRHILESSRHVGIHRKKLVKKPRPSREIAA